MVSESVITYVHQEVSSPQSPLPPCTILERVCDSIVTDEDLRGRNVYISICFTCYVIAQKFAQCKRTSFHTSIYCANSVILKFYMLPVVSMHLYSCMLFPVWCSALILTDCQSNALTPSICSIVTSLMDVMSYCYICGCNV